MMHLTHWIQCSFFILAIALANALNTSSDHYSSGLVENDSVSDQERSTANVSEQHPVHSSNLLGPSTPTVGREPPRCCVRWVHWANASTARPILLNRLQVDSLFELPANPSRMVSSTTDGGGSHKHPPAKRTLNCYLLYIYSPDCPFSASSFLHISALARAYPQIPLYLVNVRDYVAHRWSLRVLYVPKLKLIVNGRIFREYHESDFQLDRLVDFVWLAIHELPKGPINVTSEDAIAVPYIPPDRANPSLLLGSWVVTLTSLAYLLIAFGSGLKQFLSDWSYRLSGGRFGHNSNAQADAGALQNWDPGQLIAFPN